jgi:hypothetical protein
MKLKNKMNDTRKLIDNGQVIEVAPKKTVEVNNPVFNANVFEKTKEKKNEKTLDSIKKDELNKEDI